MTSGFLFEEWLAKPQASYARGLAKLSDPHLGFSTLPAAKHIKHDVKQQTAATDQHGWGKHENSPYSLGRVKAIRMGDSRGGKGEPLFCAIIGTAIIATGLRRDDWSRCNFYADGTRFHTPKPIVDRSLFKPPIDTDLSELLQFAKKNVA
ncbi:MAG: hypothetical protein GXP24_08005 [Planctomycetes bacterium]|nr:hypothetical protein [Planctomycetota bacterium]